MRIEIPRRSIECQICNTRFLAGYTLISRLMLADKGVIIRFDSCPSCNPPIVEKEISCWKTVMPSEKKRVGIKQKSESAKELFVSLINESKEHSKLYLLALYLERRRILMRRNIVEDMILFESVQTGDVYMVPNIQLSEIEFDKVGEDLKNIL